MVGRLSEMLQAALAGARPAELRRWAGLWVEAEEMWGFDLDSCVEVLRGLAQLAREASARGEGLYLWISL